MLTTKSNDKPQWEEMTGHTTKQIPQGLVDCVVVKEMLGLNPDYRYAVLVRITPTGKTEPAERWIKVESVEAGEKLIAEKLTR